MLDEALSHLSIKAACEIIASIRELRTTLILVTHNAELIGLADCLLELGAQNELQKMAGEK